MNASAQASCDYCGLPLPGGWLLRRAKTPPRQDAARPQYCCFGCRFAAAVAQERGAEGELSWTLARLGLAVFLSMNVMMFTMALWTKDVYSATPDEAHLAGPLEALFRYLCLVLSAPVVCLLGVPLARNAWESLRAGQPGTDLLLISGVAAAFAYSAWSVAAGQGHVYFEVACLVLVLVTLGRWLEAAGRAKAAAVIDSLTRLLPETVRVVVAGAERPTPRSQVAVGDVVHVLAGEVIPVDGTIRRGMAGIDERLLTGESRLIVKEPGDAVRGGTLNVDGDLLVQATDTPEGGTMQRLVAAVRHARQIKGRYERLAEKFSRLFLIVVALVALGTFAGVAWQIDFVEATLRALAVVLIACPCALGLATPMAVWAALGTAARAGVIFQHGDALQRLSAVRAVFLDKTGTLTTDAPALAFVAFAGDATPQEPSSQAALRYAAALAVASAHPLSRRVARAARELLQTVPRHVLAHVGQGETSSCLLSETETETFRGTVENVRTLAGLGLVGTLDGQDAYLGSPRLMTEAGCPLDAALRRAQQRCQAQGLTAALLGFGGTCRVLFAFREQLRASAAACVRQCAELGLRLGVLTGDSQARAAALEHELTALAQLAEANGSRKSTGKLRVLAELSPEAKVAALADARRTFGPTAMLGDGINDAPALSAADVGIALGTGADVARQAADVCLVSDDLARVPWAVGFARRAVSIIRQNLFWAFVYNIAAIALAAGGRLNPIWAAVAMLLSSVLVTANALRLAQDPREKA